MLFVVTVRVALKTGVFDPAAAQVQKTLLSIGFPTVTEVVMGKFIDVTLDASDETDARAQVEKMAKELLANPTMEKFAVVSARPG